MRAVRTLIYTGSDRWVTEVIARSMPDGVHHFASSQIEVSTITEGPVTPGMNRVAAITELPAYDRTASDALDKIRAALPPIPPADAQCHVGICLQDECQYCSRIKAAHDALLTLGHRHLRLVKGLC